LPVSRTIRTAPSRNSASYFRRGLCITTLINDASTLSGDTRAADPELIEPGEGGGHLRVDGDEEEPVAGGSSEAGPVGTSPRSTSSTIPPDGSAGSPRNTERSVSDGASNSVGQSPSNDRSIVVSKPSPSRQKRRLASTSVVQIAVWWAFVRGDQSFGSTGSGKG